MAAALVTSRAKVAFLTPSHVDALLPSLTGTDGGGASGGGCCPRRSRTDATSGLASGAPHLRHVVCCGEALAIATVTRFYDALISSELHNLYGPTEGSMTWFACPRGCVQMLVGKPISNTVPER
jgi:hypothetical protein